MRISLEYFLNKHNITFKSFCKKNRIDNYKLLESYCRDRNLVVAESDCYESIFASLNKHTSPELVSGAANIYIKVEEAEELVVLDDKKTIDEKSFDTVKALKGNNDKKEKQKAKPSTRPATSRRRSSKKSTK